ncbi:MAG: DUF87 domain-containing protein [Asgard group archaeon]|nr:DUF87 domain-containing protein [Asgard group archaeon]
MSNEERKSVSNRKKIIWIFILIAFLICSIVLLLQIDLVRELFGLGDKLSINFNKIIYITLIILGSFLVVSIGIYLLVNLYKKIPLTGEVIDANKITQKKKLLPRYRSTYILQIKGLSHKNIKNNVKGDDSLNDNFYSKNWDIIASIARVCDEISYWIIKNNNRIMLYFTISGWSWFSKNKADIKAKRSALSLKAAFNNRYPSIKFENASVIDSQKLLKIIKKCEYGLLTKGIPALKMKQAQIDRLINTFNSINEDCYYVANLEGIRKNFEKRNKSKFLVKKEENEEFNEDFRDSKKTGQSKIGVYAFSETEFGMHTILAAILSIWSGTHTFNVEKFGNNKKYYNKMQKLNPFKYLRLSNKALSSFVHLPERPYFTEDTDQPTFEIPSTTNNKYKSEISIGNIIQNDRIVGDFSLPLDSFLFNVEICGMIGRGKSYLVASIIEQILDKDLGCLIFDLKGEYAEFFANESDVDIFTIGEPAPLGINLFELNTNTDVQNVLALICEMLVIAGSPFSPTMLNIFESALEKITRRNEKSLEVFMQCLYESSEEYTTNMKTSYSRDSIDAILNRLNFIFGGINYEVFNVNNNTIDFELLDQGKKIIIDFSEYLRRGANTASIFLVCNLLLHLLSKHASNKGITDSIRYLVFLEEAMYLIPKRFNLESSASIGYSEQNFIVGRSLGIGTITVYQLWDSVSTVVHANSLTKILFRGEDVEKIRTAVNLSNDQFDYLSYLPERHFILKSKSISRPALLKTKDFSRRKLTKEKYLEIIRKKFKQRGITYSRISRSLMDLRKEIFEGKRKTNSQRTMPDLSKSVEIDNRKIKEVNHFNNNYWEWCINVCPARLEYMDKKSDWIKENICKRIQLDAQEIANNLLNNQDVSPLIEIINKKPKYLVNKILNYFMNSNLEKKNSKFLTFCTINLILNKLKTKYKFSNSWKNNLLQRIRNNLLNISLEDFSAI